MRDFSLIPDAIKAPSHPSHNIWTSFVRFASDWELDRFEAKIAWEFYRAGTVAKL